MKKKFRIAFGGGGNRSEARDIVREAAKQLGSGAAKVGRHCYADNETKVVSEIKDVKMIRRKDDKFETEIIAISRHSELQRRNPADYNLKQLQGKKNGLTETNLFTLKRVAFTLAEVLITLGIIGIVAALTLPTVIQNYQKQVTVTRLKKAYSCLVQVAQKSIADNGSIDFVEGDLLDEGAVKKFFNTYWLSYFKGVDVFPDKKRPYRLNGNTVFYKNISGILDGVNVLTHYSSGRVFFNTADGITYFVNIMNWTNKKYNDKGEVISSDAVYDSEQMVYVDLNGIKPPNTFGKDAFVFYVDFSKGIVWPYQGTCNNNSYSSGCAGKIMRDGWQIKSDYPW